MSCAFAFLIKMSNLKVYIHTQNSLLYFLLCASSWHHFCFVWTAGLCRTSGVQRYDQGQDFTLHKAEIQSTRK